MRQLKLHLVSQAESADYFLNIFAGGPPMHNKRDVLQAQQILSAILWRMVDDIQELELVTPGCTGSASSVTKERIL